MYTIIKVLNGSFMVTCKESHFIVRNQIPFYMVTNSNK